MASSTIIKFAHLQIPLEDIVKATNNFHHDNIIGHGDFGPAYKGQLLHSGKLIKITARRLQHKHGIGDIEFWTEISALSELKHTNIVSIIGYCDEKDVKIIITTYESNGSLGAYLNSPNLTWTQRLRISVGVARALSYLHNDKGRDYGFIHRNINSYTILLDENWEPKLSCFEISIKQSVNQMDQSILSDPIGTIGYTDPTIEMTGSVNSKSDTYSFGVVLFEILCGREAIIQKDANYSFLAPLAKYHYENETLHDIIQHDLRNQMFGNQVSLGSLKKYSKIAYSCLAEERAHRPYMIDIVDELEKTFEKALKFRPRHENFGKNLEHLKIQLDDIKLVTDNFSDTYKTDFNKNYIWYTTKLDCFDKEKPSSVKGKSNNELPKRYHNVVIKRFLPRDDEQEEELFFTELEMLTSVNHHNIVTLTGFCVEGFEMMLVIESSSNGCLWDYLGNVRKMRILTWEKRLKICIDIAYALNYLHSEMVDQKVIIHSNISSDKFAIDENWVTKIEDFEWAIILPPNQNDEVPCKRTYFGSKYHVDPEYAKTGKLNKESDVYSFGVVLFEILCGKHVYDQIYLKESEKGLVHVARRNFSNGTIEDIIDRTLKEGTIKNNYVPNIRANKDSLHKFLEVANQCVAESPDQRPTMEVVLNELEKSLAFQEQQFQQLGKNHTYELEKSAHEIPVEGLKGPCMEEVPDNNRMHEIVKDLEHLMIPFIDIQSATNDFSNTHKILSIQGCTLYRANLDHYDEGNHSSKRHSTVLIKRYVFESKSYDVAEFYTEIEMLSSVKHPNIVNLLGFCIEDSEMILVIENFSNGFLGQYLKDVNNTRILTWEKRLKICIDVAHALKYIHFEMKDQKMTINRDISCYNIGLDGKWGAKIVHFWWSVLLPSDQNVFYSVNRIGKPFHIDPEYESSYKLKRESDVYSFGVVLFEILCGRLAYDPIYRKESDKGLVHLARRSIYMGTLEKMVDQIIKEETGENNIVLKEGPNKDSLHTFIKIAHQCVEETQDSRPTMKVVVNELEKALFLQKNSKNNPKMSLEDIRQATENFNNDNCIGGGGFGKVYKGNLQDGNGFKTIVAKRLDTRFGQGEQQFLSELQILLDYKHQNVIGLIGYCDENDEKVIIYEYASRGSLDRYLNDASLTWVMRLNICIDIAIALDFLHGGVGKQAKVIHRDIKTPNILLNDEWKAKLADFGLSLISPLVQETDYVIDHACGTPGYLDPLYRKSGFLTIESDIYSFGVVLFEILCGRSTYVIQKHEGHHLPEFIKNRFQEGKHDEVVFGQIREQIAPKSLTTFQEIAYRCLHHEREERPTTKEVLVQLKKALALQNMPLTMTKFTPLQIPLEDVVKATNNFHHDNVIRHDEFGTEYKGQLLRFGKLMKIAARRFDCKHGKGDLKFLTEISVLFDLKHKNIVSIIGLCDEKDEKIIITTYEANGSLGQYLNNSNLTWTRRLMICVGVARALGYLHYDVGRDYAIIHCNVNSDTILLDEYWEAKLSCFESSIKELVVEKGGDVTKKLDIYSFGVVLFEILCGRKAFIQDEAQTFLAPLAKYHYENKTLHDIIHPNLLNQILSPQSLLIYTDVAYSCLNEDRAHRPDMHSIVTKLEKALELQLRRENIENKWESLKIPLSVIKQATNNFSDKYKIASWDSNILFIAELDHFDKENPSSEKGRNEEEHPKGPNTVAIKRYPSGHDAYAEEMFFTEIETLTGVKHPNIVTILGFCFEASEMILVIESLSYGFLAQYLGIKNDKRRILTWEKRLKICIDVAHALKYIHSERGDQNMIINRDICSYNIGLDENLGAKIVHFWWSVLLPPNQKALHSNWIGRPFHTDPIYEKTGKLKRETDVYGFGVILFEILCGRLAYDPIYFKESDKGLAFVARRNFCAGTLEDMIDPIIKEDSSEKSCLLNTGRYKDSLHTFVKIAYQCVAETQDQRPTMKVVVNELEKSLLLLENNNESLKISLEDIKLATQNFHDDNCIGGEGFRKVYKGNLQHGDGVDAIVAKRFDTRFGQGEQQFLSELQILWEFKHENVIGLIGYCDEKNEKIIVYEYASRGSLDRYLNDASFTWVKRLTICIDVASALDFIHEGAGKQAKVIHKDIKSANILLNHDWKAKLADFGLSLISPINQETNVIIDHVCGTRGYLDPLYGKSGFLTMESDIYSFGVVLFEILYGMSTSAIYEHQGHYLPDFIINSFEEGNHDVVVFEKIKEQIMPESLITFQKIAFQCLHHEREKRPTTKEVLTQLKEALELQVISSLSPDQGFHTRTRPVGQTAQIINRPLYRLG